MNRHLVSAIASLLIAWGIFSAPLIMGYLYVGLCVVSVVCAALVGGEER